MTENMLPQAATWIPGIYQLETDDPVIGGPGGVSNRQATELANRTLYLKELIEAASEDLASHVASNNHPLATTGAKGMVVLATTMEAQAGTDTAKVVTPAAMAAAVNAIVNAAVAGVVNSSPATLDTLAELATALGNDANFAATITAALAAKAPLANAELIGTPTAPTAAAGTNTTQLATTAFVQVAVAAAAISGLRALAYLDIGHGLENDGANGARIKLDGGTMARSANGVKVNLSNCNIWSGTQSGTEMALTDAATIGWNLSVAQEASVTLGGDRLLGDPTNIVNGTYYSLFVIQDGTGSRHLAYSAAYTGVSGVVLSNSANAIDHLVFRGHGGKMRLVSFAKNVGA